MSRALADAYTTLNAPNGGLLSSNALTVPLWFCLRNKRVIRVPAETPSGLLLGAEAGGVLGDDINVFGAETVDEFVESGNDYDYTYLSTRASNRLRFSTAARNRTTVYAANNLIEIDLGSVETFGSYGHELDYSGFGVAYCNKLQRVVGSNYRLTYGGTSFDGCPDLYEIDFPLLEGVTDFFVVDVPHLRILNVPSLAATWTAWIENVGLDTLSLPLLDTASDGFVVRYNQSLTSASFGSLLSVYSHNPSQDAFMVHDNPRLETISADLFFAYVPHTRVECQGNALTQACVDNILGLLAGGNIYNTLIMLHEGTNATPSATGLDAVAVLEARGNTVYHN